MYTGRAETAIVAQARPRRPPPRRLACGARRC